eukprot:m.85767 g.85767  ORF g.85767 m.85767 type:complete len:655 (-) comp15071_c0_seq1:283-2247(-)
MSWKRDCMLPDSLASVCERSRYLTNDELLPPLPAPAPAAGLPAPAAPSPTSTMLFRLLEAALDGVLPLGEPTTPPLPSPLPRRASPAGGGVGAPAEPATGSIALIFDKWPDRTPSRPLISLPESSAAADARLCCSCAYASAASGDDFGEASRCTARAGAVPVAEAEACRLIACRWVDDTRHETRPSAASVTASAYASGATVAPAALKQATTSAGANACTAPPAAGSGSSPMQASTAVPTCSATASRGQRRTGAPEMASVTCPAASAAAAGGSAGARATADEGLRQRNTRPAGSAPTGTAQAPPAPAARVPANGPLRLIYKFLSLLNAIVNFLIALFTSLIPTSGNNNTTNRAMGNAQGNVSLRQHFVARYGEDFPATAETTFDNALRQAQTAGRLCVAYLHSPQHTDTDDFCRTVLSNTAISTFLRENAVFWAGDVTTQHGREVEVALSATGYPFVGVYLPPRTEIGRAEGFLTADQLLTFFHEVYQANAAALHAEQVAQQERTVTQTIRQEQDAEYQESLRLDREREQQRIEEARRLENEKKAEEERIAREAAAEEAKKKELESKRDRLPSEPAESEPNMMMNIRLPDGQSIRRRFRPQETVQVIYDFVAVNSKYRDFNLVLYPRKPLDDKTLSLTDAGLTPRATLLVTDNEA